MSVGNSKSSVEETMSVGYSINSVGETMSVGYAILSVGGNNVSWVFNIFSWGNNII